MGGCGVTKKVVFRQRFNEGLPALLVPPKFSAVLGPVEEIHRNPRDAAGFQGKGASGSLFREK